MGREKWVDSIRFISIEIIFGVHFIAACAPDMSKLWHEGVTGMILCGISGKLAVAMFSVLLGYFAARAGAKADFSMSRYMCRRYIKFSVAIFGILALLAMLSFSMKALGGDKWSKYGNCEFFIWYSGSFFKEYSIRCIFL